MIGDREESTDFQEVVERSMREQWGRRRAYLVTAVLLFAVAVASAVAIFVVRDQLSREPAALQAVELSALAVTFLCLIASAMTALESVRRWQREKGQIPEKSIHIALTLSMVTVAGTLFLLFLYQMPWTGSALSIALIRVIRFVALAFATVVWIGAVVMSSAGVTMLLTRRSDLLEVHSSSEGTSVLFRKGRSTEIAKLSLAILIPLIVFVATVVMAGLYLI